MNDEDWADLLGDDDTPHVRYTTVGKEVDVYCNNCMHETTIYVPKSTDVHDVHCPYCLQLYLVPK